MHLHLFCIVYVIYLYLTNRRFLVSCVNMVHRFCPNGFRRLETPQPGQKFYFLVKGSIFQKKTVEVSFWSYRYDCMFWFFLWAKFWSESQNWRQIRAPRINVDHIPAFHKPTNNFEISDKFVSCDSSQFYLTFFAPFRLIPCLFLRLLIPQLIPVPPFLWAILKNRKQGMEPQNFTQYFRRERAVHID